MRHFPFKQGKNSILMSTENGRERGQVWGVQKLGFVATFFAQLLALS
jgi:hypothetical protein